MNKKEREIAVKTAGTVLILALGIFLLDPLSFISLRRQDSAAEPTVSPPPDSSKIPDGSLLSEYTVSSENSFVHHSVEYFDGSGAGAENHAVRQMKQKGYSRLQLPENKYQTMLFIRGEQIAGVTVRKTGTRFRIAYAELSGKPENPVKLPEELRRIAFGRQLLCIQSRRRPPILITGSSATLAETMRGIVKKLKDNSWHIPPQLPEPSIGEIRMVQARKDRWLCDIAVNAGEREFAGMNTVMYKFSVK